MKRRRRSRLKPTMSCSCALRVVHFQFDEVHLKQEKDEKANKEKGEKPNKEKGEKSNEEKEEKPTKVYNEL